MFSIKDPADCDSEVDVKDTGCKEAKLQAGIKPTALRSAIDKENSMEFSLIPLPTYTLCYCGYALTLPWSSCYSSHVTHYDCDPWCDHLWPSITLLWHCDKVMWLFPVLQLVVVSPIRRKRKRKEKKRNINNDLAVLPSHDTGIQFIIPYNLLRPCH